METHTFKYAYTALTVVFVVSIFLFVLVRGIAPMGLRALYTEGGLGTSMVVALPASDLLAGERGSFRLKGSNAVVVAEVAGARRVDGELNYYTSDDGVIEELYVARTLQGNVLFTVPLLGILVKWLQHPVGLMALLGAPLVMFFVDGVMQVGARFRARARQEEVHAEHSEGHNYSV